MSRITAAITIFKHEKHFVFNGKIIKAIKLSKSKNVINYYKGNYAHIPKPTIRDIYVVDFKMLLNQESLAYGLPENFNDIEHTGADMIFDSMEFLFKSKEYVKNIYYDINSKEEYFYHKNINNDYMINSYIKDEKLIKSITESFMELNYA